MGRATKEKKYAIIDVETTGGMHHRDKVIEVAIILTDGREIIDSFQSLVHPERSIPYHITRITGIDDDMVADAPRFYEIAKDIIEIMDGAIFVAHNVKFDYNFIKEEFKSLGYAFNKKRLCTVKLTRSTMPGLRSYGLDNLIKHFDIEVDARHRAYDDTLATWKIFKTIISDMDDSYHVNQLINEGLDASILPRGMSMDEMHATPETPGVYYLCNEEDDVLYVGKAKNIRSRLFQHFRNLSRKSTKIYAMVHRLHYKETGSELLALLLELYEIKRLKPELNKALRRTDYNYALYLYENAAQGKPRLILNKNNKANDLKYQKLKLYSSKGHAESSLQELLLHHEICIRHAKSRATEFACYCEGSCEEVLHKSQEGVEHLLDQVKHEFERDFILILPGRNPEESGFVMIHENSFWGFGYVPRDTTLSSREEWNDYVNYQFWYPEASGLVHSYRSKHRCKMIYLD